MRFKNLDVEFNQTVTIFHKGNATSSYGDTRFLKQEINNVFINNLEVLNSVENLGNIEDLKVNLVFDSKFIDNLDNLQISADDYLMTGRTEVERLEDLLDNEDYKLYRIQLVRHFVKNMKLDHIEVGLK